MKLPKRIIRKEVEKHFKALIEESEDIFSVALIKPFASKSDKSKILFEKIRTKDFIDLAENLGFSKDYDNFSIVGFIFKKRKTGEKLVPVENIYKKGEYIENNKILWYI